MPAAVREVTPARFERDRVSRIPHTHDAMIEYQCEVCAYGTASIVPFSCPMCGCDSWRRSRRKGGAAVTVIRVGDETFLVTAPSELDAGGVVALAETVAGLAHEQPRVVIDLTRVDILAEHAVQLTQRLGALARGSGGRLLVISRSESREGVEICEVGAGEHGSPRLDGVVRGALRSVVNRTGDARRGP